MPIEKYTSVKFISTDISTVLPYPRVRYRGKQFNGRERKSVRKKWGRGKKKRWTNKGRKKSRIKLSLDPEESKLAGLYLPRQNLDKHGAQRAPNTQYLYHKIPIKHIKIDAIWGINKERSGGGKKSCLPD